MLWASVLAFVLGFHLQIRHVTLHFPLYPELIDTSSQFMSDHASHSQSRTRRFIVYSALWSNLKRYMSWRRFRLTDEFSALYVSVM